MDKITEQQYRERLVGLGIMEAGGANPEWLAKVRENLDAQWLASHRASWWQRLKEKLPKGNTGNE